MSASCCDPRRAASVDELRAAATNFARRLSCDHFGYLLLRPPRGASLDGEVLVSDYPGEWQERYAARHYKYYDPVVTISHDKREPFCWGHPGFLAPYGKAARLVFDEAGEYRIFEGCGVPTAGVGGDAGIFTMALSERRRVQDVLHEESEAIQVFAAEFHERAVSLTCAGDLGRRLELTPRQREVLSWTAEGLSSEATAARIGITVSAVNYHLAVVSRRLGAANKIQAVALAIRRALI